MIRIDPDISGVSINAVFLKKDSNKLIKARFNLDGLSTVSTLREAKEAVSIIVVFLTPHVQA